MCNTGDAPELSIIEIYVSAVRHDAKLLITFLYHLKPENCLNDYVFRFLNILLIFEGRPMFTHNFMTQKCKFVSPENGYLGLFYVRP